MTIKFCKYWTLLHFGLPRRLQNSMIKSKHVLGSSSLKINSRKPPAKIQSYRDSIPDLCDTGRALYPINWWSPLQFVSSSRTSNSSYSYIYYLIEVYATGIFFLSFLVLQYVQNMYLKFKRVNYIATPIFLSSKLANLPSRMSALSRGQNDKCDVQRFGVT